MRYDEDDRITFMNGGSGGGMPLSGAGTIGVGGTFVTESAGSGGADVVGGAGGFAGAVAASGMGGTAGEDPRDKNPPRVEPCDPNHDPLDPTSMTPCTPLEPPPDDCDELAREYELEVGAAQWCRGDADCHRGIPVTSTLHCGCEVIVQSIRAIAPIAAEWRAHACRNERPCSVSCLPAAMPYRCGEAGFCLDDNQ